MNRVLIVKEKRKIFTIGMAGLLGCGVIGMLICMLPSETNEDVLFLALLILVVVAASVVFVYMIIAFFTHKLVLFADGVFKFQSFFRHTQFTKYDIGKVEETLGPYADIIIKNHSGEILAKVEKNMDGYAELSNWLQKENLTGSESEEKFLSSKDSYLNEKEIPSSNDYEENTNGKKIVKVEIVLLAALLVWGFMSQTTEALSLWFVVSSICWYVLSLFSLRNVRKDVLAKKVKNNIKEREKHSEIIGAAFAISLFLYYYEVDKWITLINGKWEVIFFVLSGIALLVYFLMTGAKGWRAHLEVAVLLVAISFMIVSPLNHMLVKEDSIAMKSGVVEDKRISLGSRGRRHENKLEVKFEDGTTYSFTVDKFDYDFSKEGDPVWIKMWESQLGFEYGMFWKNGT